MKQIDIFERSPRIKECPKCNVEKTAFEFPVHNAKSYSCGRYCLACQRLYSRAHYQKNKASHNPRRAQHTVEYRNRNRIFIAQILAKASCVDCGERDPIVLEFDHVRGQKKYDIAFMTNAGIAIRTLESELAKCVVRCANCHRRRTARLGGYWKGSARLRAEQEHAGR